MVASLVVVTGKIAPLHMVDTSHLSMQLLPLNLPPLHISSPCTCKFVRHCSFICSNSAAASLQFEKFQTVLISKAPIVSSLEYKRPK